MSLESDTPAATRVKEQQIRHWNAVAGGWADWFEWTERNFRPLTEWCRDVVGWAPGARALDIACGAGYPALAAAACLRPGGALVAIDISRAMLAAAANRVAAAGFDHVDLLEMDAEHLELDDNSFDAATNTYGLMFCPDPVRAVREVRRVLKPGGRYAFVVWDQASTNPFLTVAADSAAELLSLRRPDPSAPGPFRLAQPGALASTMREGGLSNFRIEKRSMTFECLSVDEYFQIFTDLVWKSRIASLSGDETARLRRAILHAAKPYIKDGRLLLGTSSLCACGRK